MKEFLKKEPVLSIAAILAIVSAFIVKPSIKYLTYIDFRVLILLFCLMIVVGGMQAVGVFEAIAGHMLKHIMNMRQLYVIMVSLCFFSSMLITNDVALITFIPFTIIILNDINKKDKMIVLIVLETIAANLGSMLTPLGNPQNLYIFSVSKMALGEFISTMFPITAASYLLLNVIIRICENKSDRIDTRPAVIRMEDKKRLFFYSVLFILCIGTVLHFLHHFILLGIILLGAWISDKSLIKRADYSLLFTFTAFFVFIGNMQHIEVIQNFIQSAMKEHTMLFAVSVSQIISNVPAAVLLSGFTNNYVELLKGVNIGGLGTLIASMASLISYRYYANTKEAHTGKYIGVFTGMNMIFLAVLLVTELLIG